MKKILVPTDFSPCANHAAEAAINLALKFDAELHFLHFLSIPVDWMMLDGLDPRLYPDINKKLKSINKQLEEWVGKAEQAGVTASHFVKYEDAYVNVLDHARKFEIDMIVMGSHGADGIREFFVGSNAQKIVRLSHVPVLIIREEAPVDFDQMIFISDYLPESEEAFADVVGLAEKMRMGMNLAFINTQSDFEESHETKAKMERYELVAGPSLQSSEIVNAFTFEQGLERYASQFNHPLIAMATHGRSGFTRMVYGSLTESIVNHIKTPILSLPMTVQEVVAE